MENPLADGTKAPDPETIGLLLVHGIGAQESGETTANFVKGFLRAFPEAVFDEDNRTLAVEARLIRLYEAYWADLLKDEKMKGSFNREIINAVAWFPWLHYRARSYAPGDYSFFLVAGRTLMLVPVGVIFQLMYQGAHLLAGSVQAFFDAAKGRSSASDARPHSDPKQSLLRRAKSEIEASAQRGRDRRTLVDDILDEYAGDVFAYVDSAGRALQEGTPFFDISDQVNNRFYEALKQASDDGCSEIQIVAHSLGTVVAHLALSGHNLTRIQQREEESETAGLEPLAGLTRIYTIGSPLEKIRFVWPKLITTELIERIIFVNKTAKVVSTTSYQAAGYRLRWDNFYDPFDKVSGKLKRFNHWGGVTNHRLLGLGGPLRSHVNYQSSRGFLSVVSEGLVGKKVIVKNTLFTRIKNIILSLGENALVLVAVPVTFVIGLALVVLVAGGFAFLLGWLVRLVGVSEHTTNVVKDWTMISIVVLFLIGMVFGGKARAREAHQKHWALRHLDETVRVEESMAARS